MYPTMTAFGAQYPAHMAHSSNSNSNAKPKTEEPEKQVDKFERSSSQESLRPPGYLTPFGMQLYGQPVMSQGRYFS